jgi:hypothetical protein
MSKTDIFGKKPYKNTQVKSAKVDFLTYCYVLAVRTDADMLRFSKLILTETNYLFSISQARFQAEELDKFSSFQAFVHKDIISDNKVFYLQNTGFESNRTILGYKSDALFQIKRQKQRQKRKNQLSLLFEEEAADLMDFNQEADSNEIRDWYDFKDDLSKNSVDIMGKIDYLFPMQIERYEILKPLLQHLHKIKEINYMLLDPERIENAASFFKHIDLMTERVNFAHKKASFLKR